MNWLIIVFSIVGAVVGFFFGFRSAQKKVKANLQKQLEAMQTLASTGSDENTKKEVEGEH